MRFEVPQFIDVEDKIFGPFTFKQFIYLVGGGSLAYVSYKLILFPIWPIVSLFFILAALALAFYKINNQSFITVAQAWFTYQFKGKQFIWRRAPIQSVTPQDKVPAPAVPVTKQVTAEQITALAQNLDILDAGK